MSDFVKYSLDYDGVEQQGNGDYVAKCSLAAAGPQRASPGRNFDVDAASLQTK